MSQIQGPILDYASPATKSKFRVGTKSVLRKQWIESTLRIVESLENHTPAILAIIFTSCSLILLVASFTPWRLPRQAMFFFFIATSPLTLGGLITTILVIDSNWQRTVFEVGPERIAIRFWSPLRGERSREWRADILQSVMIVQQRLTPSDPSISALELDLAGDPLVRLFSGHPYPELKQLHREIGEIWKPLQPIDAGAVRPGVAPGAAGGS